MVHHQQRAYPVQSLVMTMSIPSTSESTSTHCCTCDCIGDAHCWWLTTVCILSNSVMLSIPGSDDYNGYSHHQSSITENIHT